jgi:hypothetical protein
LQEIIRGASPVEQTSFTPSPRGHRSADPPANGQPEI